jgi:hypothetical protein
MDAGRARIFPRSAGNARTGELELTSKTDLMFQLESAAELAATAGIRREIPSQQIGMR